MRSLYICVILVTIVQTVLCAGQLLTNADLEENKLSRSDGGWYCNGCHASLSTDRHTGTHSVKVTNRKASYSGLWYDLTLTPGERYYLKAYIKLLHIPTGKMTEDVKIKAVFHAKSGDEYTTIGENKYMQPNIWQAVGGDYIVPTDVTSGRLYVAPTNPEVTFVMDTTSLANIPALPHNWRAAANATIDRIRKADIVVSVDGHHSHSDLQDVSVEITQTSHKFAFGSAVKAAWMIDSAYRKYQQCFYDNFEWGVIENALKWRTMQYNEGHIKYDAPLKAIDEMRSHGIKLRAHTLFWSKPSTVPNWALNSTSDVLRSQMVDRINNIVPKVKGKVEHWDVNNENLHFNFFEEGTGDVNITMWMFREVHKIDPNVKLFLSDYDILKSSREVQAYSDQARMFKNTKNLPMYGLSIHAHLSPPLDMAVEKYRLGQLGVVGLPMWVTELDISEHVDKRADHLSDILTLLFSTPEVEGVLLWGFWDKGMSRDASLFDGDNLVPNEAGQRYQQLTKHDWRTVETKSLTSGNVNVRAFKGDYSVKVIRHGKVLHQESVTLDDGGLSLKVSLSGSGQNLHVSHVLVG